MLTHLIFKPRLSRLSAKESKQTDIHLHPTPSDVTDAVTHSLSGTQYNQLFIKFLKVSIFLSPVVARIFQFCLPSG